MSEMNVTFEPKIVFAEILSFGTVNFNASLVTDIFTEIISTYTGEMKLKSDNKTFVSSYNLLPDGSKLVLDSNNDKRNTFVTETILPVKENEQCHSIVLNSNSVALVSTSKGRFFKVKIGVEQSVSEIKSKYRITTMTKYGDYFLCLIVDKDGDQAQLCIIAKDMSKIIKTILKDDRTLFFRPLFLGVSADKNTVYVLDSYKGCYGISLDGQVVFHYQNPEAEYYTGLAVDIDELFIGAAVGDKGQVEKLNLSGERQEVCTGFGEAYPLKLVENELVLSKDDIDVIEFYCFIK